MVPAYFEERNTHNFEDNKRPLDILKSLLNWDFEIVLVSLLRLFQTNWNHDFKN